MSQKNTPLPLTTRADEDKYLRETLEVVKANTADYSRQAAQMKADIDDMLEHYHDNDMESLTELNNTVTLYEHVKTALEHNTRALAKPYFGRIIYQDGTLHKQESLYIGRGGISRDTIHPVVIDWRAPVANAYYEIGLGPCSYTAPGGAEMPIDLQLKRTYEIADGKLLEYFDSEVIANDELLTRYLAKNKQAVLSEIVATIQKEQNEIIRLTPYRNLIVQGVAGSGKTTVAMHRISYILYNYAERFRPEDFYIVGSNRILLNYITGVLPDLDVHGVRQMTMAQLFTRLLYEEWDERKYRIDSSVRENIRGKLSWFEDLKAFCDQFEWNFLPHTDIYLETDDTVSSMTTRVQDKTLLLGQDAIEKYIRENPTLSLQSKIDNLNERLTAQIHNHFLEHIGRYTEDERKEILRAFRGWFGGKKMRLSIFKLYDHFLAEQRAKGIHVSSPSETVVYTDVTQTDPNSVSYPAALDPHSSLKTRARKTVRHVMEFDVYDLAALAYLYARITETEVIQEAHHVVIDEAQDFGMMAYAALSHCIRGCTYTIMGDVSQNIHFESGLNDWEELKTLLLKDPADSFRVLKKSYRNTVEISEYALRILRHGSFSVYPVEPIIRHGAQVREIQIKQQTALSAESSNVSELIRCAVRILKQWQTEGFLTLAVVCRDAQTAARTVRELKHFLPVCGDDLENAVFGEGIMVLPVEYTKGLEFDAVLLLDPTAEEYPVDDRHAKLLYVAATRALHKLCVLHTGNLTGLITEEPRSEVSVYEDKTVRTTAPVFREKTKSEPTTLFFASGKSLQMPDQYDASSILQKARQEYQNGRIDAAAPPKPKAVSQKMTAADSLYAEKPGTSESRKAASLPGFGDIPPEDALKPLGHAKIDLAVRWISRQPDGLCLQSRYGTLRLSPVTSRIIRISFARPGQLNAAPHPKIAAGQSYKAWMYREIGGSAELLTDDLCLRVDKSAGSVQYLTRDRKTLLSERMKDCRQLEAANSVSFSARLYLNQEKKESLTAISTGKSADLRGNARFISGNDPDRPFPLILSDRGYGLMIAAQSPVIFCDLPKYGTYIHITKCAQMDFYFLLGNERECLSACDYLCGSCS